MAIAAYDFQPIDSIEMIKGRTYDATMLPEVANILRLTKGVLLESGSASVRGIRMSIKHNETSATNPQPSVPMIWAIGAEIVFNPDYVYTAHDDGVVTYGIKANVV